MSTDLKSSPDHISVSPHSFCLVIQTLETRLHTLFLICLDFLLLSTNCCLPSAAETLKLQSSPATFNRQIWREHCCGCLSRPPFSIFDKVEHPNPFKTLLTLKSVILWFPWIFFYITLLFPLWSPCVLLNKYQ